MCIAEIQPGEAAGICRERTKVGQRTDPSENFGVHDTVHGSEFERCEVLQRDGFGDDIEWLVDEN